MKSLRVSGLHKAFGPQPVLRGLDLQVEEGTRTAILGPSGSGKTTLLRVVAGFERADAGSVVIGGRVVEGAGHYVAPEHRGIGYVPQEGSLFPHLTVAKNVAFGLGRAERRSRRVEELLQMVGLQGLGQRYPHELSGGQQQRVALARALAVDPELVLLDEPFSSLDPSLRASVRDDVQEVLRRSGTTALLVTHDQDEALSWADHVALIRHGRIGQFDTPHGLYAAPSDPEVARFLGEANLLQGVCRRGAVETVLGALALREGSPCDAARAVVLVRPEQLELSAPEEGLLRARVVEYRYFGHDAVVRLQPLAAGGAAGEPLVARTTAGSAWEPGQEVGLRVRGPVLAWESGEEIAAS